MQIQLAYLFMNSMGEGFYLKELISFHLICVPLSRSESFQRILLQQLQTCLECVRVVFHRMLCSDTAKRRPPSGWWEQHREEYTLDTARHRWRCCRTPPPHPHQGTETGGKADTLSHKPTFAVQSCKCEKRERYPPLPQASRRWGRPSPTSPPPGCSRHPSGPQEPEIPESHRMWRCDLHAPSLGWKWRIKHSFDLQDAGGVMN